MPSITIDGQQVECREGDSVLKAALRAGWDVPHFCYHPGLSVTASCRLCLMEMKARDPRKGTMDWMPKLVPSCQTPVADGMEVRFDSDTVRAARRRAMEMFLLNHPLDCPVCDQAGECFLQDFAERFGEPVSRMVEQKHKTPKKDIGSKTYLYSDRCVVCTRCVRFCDEVAGTDELGIVNRGSRSEIDVFPGEPLENALQGNVVDLCPVGAMLDKAFLMSYRVWNMRRVKSICPGCATGCAVWIDHDKDVVRRLKPRVNPGVNDHWMCDEGRFGWEYVHDERRLKRLLIRDNGLEQAVDWAQFPAILKERLGAAIESQGAAKAVVVLSPFMSCEEAWLLATYARSLSPDIKLAMGPVPVVAEDRRFPEGTGRDVRFTIRAEKCPNKRGIEMVLEAMGGPVCSFDDFVSGVEKKSLTVAWVVGGHPGEWVPPRLSNVARDLELLIAQDLFESVLTEAADVVIPACAWPERAGTFVNVDGRVQPFEAAVRPPDGCRRDGQWLYALVGETGLYDAAEVRRQMAETIPAMGMLHVPPEDAEVENA